MRTDNTYNILFKSSFYISHTQQQIISYAQVSKIIQSDVSIVKSIISNSTTSWPLWRAETQKSHRSVVIRGSWVHY